tara:strand:- start:527 stop:811 length:285 start_codon:yes stop_codon:yes gene_type:complete
MKLEINESYEGELSDEAQRVRDKANWALQAALRAAGVPSCCGGLEKSLKSSPENRIGEMQVLEELTLDLAKMYEERLSLLQRDLLDRIEEENDS